MSTEKAQQPTGDDDPATRTGIELFLKQQEVNLLTGRGARDEGDNNEPASWTIRIEIVNWPGNNSYAHSEIKVISQGAQQQQLLLLLLRILWLARACKQNGNSHREK